MNQQHSQSAAPHAHRRHAGKRVTWEIWIYRQWWSHGPVACRESERDRMQELMQGGPGPAFSHL